MIRRPSIRGILMDLPIPRKLTLIIGLFSVVVFVLLTLSYFGMEILSGSRAYVGGEGLWSKAQKGAVYSLTRYALYHDEADYQKYLEHISIPLGDHKARGELAKPAMNYSAVVDGFVQGRNDPADVKIMAWMARKLHSFHYMSKPINIWGQADNELGNLQLVAGELHQEISSGQTRPSRIKTLLENIQAIDARLTPLEDEFSYTLGQGARWLKRVLLMVMILATCAFLAVTLVIAFLISRHLCHEIDHLRAGASRIAGGDYSFTLDMESKDEIGDLARSFHQMAAQRQQSERLKDEFFANVSHELRTPLTLILSPLESLLAGDYGAMDSKVQPALEIMHNNVLRLLQLVNGLLDFSKLEAGKIHVNREPLRITELTQAIYQDFKPLMQERGILSIFESDAPEAIVMMDRYLYERVLFNLMSNAVKFTKPGGQVTVRLHWANDSLALSVSDTGIGIPSEELGNIFQRFRQVEGSSTRRFEGTGLGLALVKEFTSILDGTISVQSTVGQGTTFAATFAAPLATSPASVKLEPAPSPDALRPQQYGLSLAPTAAASGNRAPKVLIAEDNLEMGSYIASLLAPFCVPKIVRDGNEALSVIHDWAPDLVLTDVMMPERDGLSLCREVKSNPATAAIPIVMLTALTHRDALLEGWKAGADEYLFKPFHPKELVTRIQSLLKARTEKEQADAQIASLNEDLKRHARELEMANRELEAFSYSVSHDLRTPLRAIDGFSKELLQNCNDALDVRGKEDLDRIRTATHRMSQLIEDLLELSRLSRRDMSRTDVDLSTQVYAIAEELQKSDPERPVDWVIAPQVTAHGDAHLMRVALENLIQNAWKFTQYQPRPKIEFGTFDRLGKKNFFIRDNGVGFNMEYAGKLFKPFQRLHDAKQFPGTGIGLALAQRIISRHGGEIGVEAFENWGATFYFWIPSAIAESRKEASDEFQSRHVG